jgi:hypothetical protein
MEIENTVNLKRFIPKKASRFYVIKIILYVSFLVALGTILQYQLGKKEPKLPATNEIKGVEIDLQ